MITLWPPSRNIQYHSSTPTNVGKRITTVHGMHSLDESLLARGITQKQASKEGST